MAGWINLLFFAFFTARALLLAPALDARRRRRVVITGAPGIALSLLLLPGRTVADASVLTYVADWLPAPLMLLAYRQTGNFFVRPDGALQAKLEAFDRALFKHFPAWEAGRRGTRAVLGYLELAYLFCYLLIPLGVGVLYLARMRSEVNAYWSIVLPAAYLCYAATAFLHTLPPRVSRPEGLPPP